MKLAWIFKNYEEDEWRFQLHEPEFFYEKKQIVYAFIEEAE